MAQAYMYISVCNICAHWKINTNCHSTYKTKCYLCLNMPLFFTVFVASVKNLYVCGLHARYLETIHNRLASSVENNSISLYSLWRSLFHGRTSGLSKISAHIHCRILCRVFKSNSNVVSSSYKLANSSHWLCSALKRVQRSWTWAS